METTGSKPKQHRNKQYELKVNPNHPNGTPTKLKRSHTDATTAADPAALSLPLILGSTSSTSTTRGQPKPKRRKKKKDLDAFNAHEFRAPSYGAGSIARIILPSDKSGQPAGPPSSAAMPCHQERMEQKADAPELETPERVEEELSLLPDRNQETCESGSPRKRKRTSNNRREAKKKAWGKWNEHVIPLISQPFLRAEAARARREPLPPLPGSTADGAAMCTKCSTKLSTTSVQLVSFTSRFSTFFLLSNG
jgi:hypothetical protein